MHGQGFGARERRTGKISRDEGAAYRQARHRGNGTRESEGFAYARKRGNGARESEEAVHWAWCSIIASALQLLHLAAGQLLPVLAAVAYSPVAVSVIIHLILRSEVAIKVFS